MAIHIKQEHLESECVEIVKGLKLIQNKQGFKNVRLIMNDDGSGEIQGFNPKKGLAFNKVKGFKNFDELLAILNEYFFAR